MRASLQSGNLLTGSLYVTLEYYPEEPLEEVGTFAGYPTVPTVSGGLARIERQVSDILTMVNELPLEATLAELRATLQTFGPGSHTMGELNRTLRALEALSRTLQDQPNSIVFPKHTRTDPVPGGEP